MTRDVQPVYPPDPFENDLAELNELVDGDDKLSLLFGGEAVELPDPAVAALRAAVEYMSEGNAVMVVPVKPYVTPVEAADLLGLSLPRVRKLIAGGDLRTVTGEHTPKVSLGDIVEYQHKQTRATRGSLDRIVAISDQVGLYQLPGQPPGT